MLPFSKRPPPPEEYFLRSGDFEAVRQDSYAGPGPNAHASPAIPPAPRAPVFARQAAQTPYGFSQNQQNQYGSGQYGSLSAPPPPHSLAPVAMGAMGPDSTGRNMAYTSSRTNGTVVVREKPSLKWGVMIALTGALLGGVLGLSMDQRRQNARAAAAAADARDNAPPAMVAAALPNVANALTATPRPAAPPAVAAPVAAAAAPVGPTAAALPAGVTAPPAPVVLAAVAPVVVPPKATDVAPKTAHTASKTITPPKSHFLAAKVQTPAKPAPEKADAPEPTKTAKADPPAVKPKKEAASTSDAMKILEAANKDTTNTL